MEYDRTEIPSLYDKARALLPETARLWLNLLSVHIDETATLSLIVDLGCGTGRFSDLIATAFEVEVIGIDPSQKMIEQARRKNPKGKVSYRHAPAEALPLADSCADLIFMSNVYHHWLLSASGVMEARGGGFGYDDGSRRSGVAGEHGRSCHHGHSGPGQPRILARRREVLRLGAPAPLARGRPLPWMRQRRGSPERARRHTAASAAVSLPGVRVALRRPQRDCAGRPPPAAADLGVVPLLHGSEPVQPADRRGTGSRHLGRAVHDRAGAQRLGCQGT